MTPLERQRSRDIHELLDKVDWYRRCLEDVVDGRPVRNLDEAKIGYDHAMSELRTIGKSR